MSTNKAQSLNLMFVDAKEARWSKLNAADFQIQQYCMGLC